MNYDELIIKRVKEIDRRLRKFLLSLYLALDETSNKVNREVETSDEQKSILRLKMEQANTEILASIANDFQLRTALDSILLLEKYFESHSLTELDHEELRKLHKLVEKFLKSLGLNWISIYEKSHMLELIIELHKFREHVRKSAMHGLKIDQSAQLSELHENFGELLSQSEILLKNLSGFENKESKNDEFFILLLKKLRLFGLTIKDAAANGLKNDYKDSKNIFVNILNHCDALRNDLRETGIVIGDKKA